jgi:hypothetical protein
VSVESDADRLAMLADFGTTADWTVGVTTTEDIAVLFDNGTIEQTLQETVAAQNRRATITLRASDLPVGAGASTDTIVVGGNSYHPKGPMPDGEGLVVVHLEAV